MEIYSIDIKKITIWLNLLVDLNEVVAIEPSRSKDSICNLALSSLSKYSSNAYNLARGKTTMFY